MIDYIIFNNFKPTGMITHGMAMSIRRVYTCTCTGEGGSVRVTLKSSDISVLLDEDDEHDDGGRSSMVHLRIDQERIE